MGSTRVSQEAEGVRGKQGKEALWWFPEEHTDKSGKQVSEWINNSSALWEIGPVSSCLVLEPRVIGAE